MAGCLIPAGVLTAQTDTTNIARNYTINEVVVTGTRNETDIRHLPMTVSIIKRQQIEQTHEPSLLPILTEQIPGLFTTARGVMGFGVSDGAAGQMSLRGIGGPGSPAPAPVRTRIRHAVRSVAGSGVLLVDRRLGHRRSAA